MRPHRHPPHHRLRWLPARAPIVAIVAAALIVSACASDVGPAPAISGGDPPDSRGTSGNESDELSSVGDLTLVLPSTDRLAPAERDRVRRLVSRVLDEVTATGLRPTLLEPASSDVLHEVVELAVRRSDMVCVLGRDGAAALAAALVLYPSRHGCLLPLGGGGEGRQFGTDIDLNEIGRALGAAARVAAGDGTVVVLDGGDGMLDGRWARGVRTAAEDDTTVSAEHIVRSASELIGLLDMQADSLEAGVVPGSPAVLADLGERPVALTLPPVQLVVLDASTDAAALIEMVLERGLLVIAPRSLLEGRADHPGVVMHWRIRWDVPLAMLLSRAIGGERPIGFESGSALDLLVMERGPVAPSS